MLNPFFLWILKFMVSGWSVFGFSVSLPFVLCHFFSYVTSRFGEWYNVWVLLLKSLFFFCHKPCSGSLILCHSWQLVSDKKALVEVILTFVNTNSHSVMKWEKGLHSYSMKRGSIISHDIQACCKWSRLITKWTHWLSRAGQRCHKEVQTASVFCTLIVDGSDTKACAGDPVTTSFS